MRVTGGKEGGGKGDGEAAKGVGSGGCDGAGNDGALPLIEIPTLNAMTPLIITTKNTMQTTRRVNLPSLIGCWSARVGVG